MTDEDLRALLDAATKGPWHYECKPQGPKANGRAASIGIWSEFLYKQALASDDGDIDADDAKWVAGIWGVFGYVEPEDTANARLIAAAPDLAAEVLRLRVALDDIRCGRGMFGLDPAEDLKWAMNTAGTALGDAP